MERIKIEINRMERSIRDKDTISRDLIRKLKITKKKKNSETQKFRHFIKLAPEAK